MAIRGYRRGEHQNPPYPLKVAPTYQERVDVRFKDYRLKCLYWLKPLSFRKNKRDATNDLSEDPIPECIPHIP